MDFDLDKEYEEKDIKKEPKQVDDGFDIFSDVDNSDDERQVCSFLRHSL